MPDQAFSAGSGASLTGFLSMALLDFFFLAAVFLLMTPIFAWRPASYAVMKRNFVNYFSNPTGYVFLCVFVLLTSFAAFWPHEFFANNLANFDQLNKVLPYIMLIFIPAITMSIWAEERRQGTDELLLTLPAMDFDIVIGKYFAAVFVFTVSLLFSQLSNFAVLLALTGGALDDGILMSTYLGYWFVGIGMLSLGMVASFLTNNLTVSFIFGVVFNAPLAFFSNADVLFSSQSWVEVMYEWSLLRRFGDFGRGLIALPSIVYFIGIAVIGIYLSLMLIGRRHWMGGRDGQSLLGHLIVRAISLVVACLALVMVCQYTPINRILRMDLSTGSVNTLAQDSISLLNNLKENPSGDGQERNTPKQITIEAYISSDLPPEYVQTRYELVNLLKEFDVIGGDRIQLRLHENVSPFGEEAILAENKYGIKSQRVTTRSRGALRDEDVILGVAFSSGLQRVVIPFFHYGMPVEYELVRSISTVAAAQRKTIGVINTEAFLTGARMDTPEGPQFLPKAKIVVELEKQYEVVDINANDPIEVWTDATKAKRKYDVLLVAQPSKMDPIAAANLLTALRTGQPAAIFEDPLSFGSIKWPVGEIQDQNPADYFPLVPGTTVERVTKNVSPDLEPLYNFLGLDPLAQVYAGGKRVPGIVWQKNTTYPQSLFLNKHLEYVVVQRNTNAVIANELMINPEHPISESINELAFPYPGAIGPLPNKRWEITPLVQTARAGVLWFADFAQSQGREQEIKRMRGRETDSKIIAVEVNGGADDGSAEGARVVYVADIDVLADHFVNLRNLPTQSGVEYRFDNVAFVLNIFDYLSGEDRYINIRNRRAQQYTLGVVENEREREWEQVNEVINQQQKDIETTMNQARQDFADETTSIVRAIEDLDRRKKNNEAVDSQLQALIDSYQQKAQAEERSLQEKLNLENLKLKDEERRIRMNAEIQIQKIQGRYKVLAVLLPPIPPLILGLIVFTRRRLREREGISKARLRTEI